MIDVERAHPARTRCGQLRERVQQHARIHAAAECHGNRAAGQFEQASLQSCDQGHARMVPEVLARDSPLALAWYRAILRRGGELMVIKRVAVLKLAIFQSALMAAFGLIAALIFMLFGAMFSGLAGHQAAGVMGIAGIAMLIFLPIMYGVIGFIAGAIGAALYNLVAGVVGGIEIEVE